MVKKLSFVKYQSLFENSASIFGGAQFPSRYNLYSDIVETSFGG